MTEKMTEQEVADYLGVSTTTIVKTWKRGRKKGPLYHKVSHGVGYYDRTEVEQFKKDNPILRSAYVKLSDAIPNEDFAWDWATPEAMNKLEATARSFAGRYGLDVDDIVSEACVYIAARPDYFEKRKPGYVYDTAAEHAARNLRIARDKINEVEKKMTDNYWETVS